MTSPAVQLWFGRTVHERRTPFRRRFSYRIGLIDLDLDRLAEAGRATVLLGIDRPGLFSFRSKDHGPREQGASLKDWALGLLGDAGVDLGGGKIRLVTFPRHLFYKFAPISLWYGYSRSGELRGIIYEVKNTFGERHCYVAQAGGPVSKHRAEKMLHVSPFFDVSGEYRFVLRAPGNLLKLTVNNYKDNELQHLATIAAHRADATAMNFARLGFGLPLSSLGVTAAIHWQALKLWLRGARYHSKPPAPAAAHSRAA
jgi:DUF1365 family protein